MATVQLVAPPGITGATLPDGTRLALQQPDGTISVDSKWAPELERAGFTVRPVSTVHPTAGRPTTGLQVGQMIWDSTLGLPLWWNGTVWKDATGATK